MSEYPPLGPSGIGEAVNRGLSPWFIKLRFEDDTPLDERRWPEALRPLSTLQSQTGNIFEADVYDLIEEDAQEIVDSWSDYDEQDKNRRSVVSEMEDVANREEGFTALEQLPVAGAVGEFQLAGDVDLVIAWPQEGDLDVHVRVFDIKRSWDEKTYQQIQTACYTILLDRVLPDDIQYEVSAGIIYQETELNTLSPEALPEFSRGPREQDVKRLLRDDGPFAAAFNRSFDDVLLDVESEAPTSPYGDLYTIRGIENQSLSLVGLSRGEQRTLAEHGITSLEDLASMVEPPESPKPYDFSDPKVRKEYRTAVRTLEEEHGFGERLPILAQRAQAMLGGLDSDHPDAHQKPWTPWLKGVGVANLPDDEPKYDTDELTIEEGSLIRVYLNVQYDYVRDRITLVSAMIDSAQYDGEPLRVSHCVDEINYLTGGNDAQEHEHALLRQATKDIFEAIRAVSDLAGLGNTAPVHFYTYTSDEQDALIDGLREYPDDELLQALRDLFSLREGVDQAMVSAVQPEVEQRIARKVPSTGLTQMVEELNPRDDDDKLQYEDWTYHRDDGTEVDLREAFRLGTFDYMRGYVENDGGISIPLDGNPEYDGFYSALPRFDAQIPLEYIWATVGMFNASWSEEPRTKSLIENYRWVDKDRQDARIKKEDIESLGVRLAKAVRHVERSLVYKDPSITKKNIDIGNIESFTLGKSSLAEATRECLDLEYHDSRTEALQEYRRPAKQRILNGRSVPFRITDTEDFGYMLRAEGELIYDSFTFENPEQVASASRVSGSDAASSGTFLVATPLSITPTGYETDVSFPENIENSTPVTVQEFDPSTNHIVIEAYRQSSNDDAHYSTWNRPWTVREQEAEKGYKVLFESDREFVLDVRADSGSADKATVALDNVDANPVYNYMNDLRTGKRTTVPRDPIEAEGAEAWLSWVGDNLELNPNKQQKEFIRMLHSKIGLLQGPPGTGKTSGALAHALLARAYGYSSIGRPMRGVVTGASNKAVDEVLEDVAELADAYEGEEFEQLTLVRLVLGGPPKDGHDNVEYVNYHDDEAMMYALKKNLLKDDEGDRQSSLESFGENPKQSHTIVFGTPARVQRMVQELDSKTSIEDHYSGGSDLFDVLAADEASMLPLHQLFMCSSFVDEENGQTLLAGDHRQMPPIQSYPWEDETRQTIERYVPYLSTLNYFRFLRGDSVDRVDEEVTALPDADVPITRLQQTYRCHRTVANFLQRWVYEQDGIDYTSEELDTISSPTAATDGLSEALNADAPLTLLLHDDRSSRQSNHTEAAIASAIAADIPSSEDVGIVTPHNAQKGLLTQTCGDRAQVDTVERFQGGERDVMILSATVSDPDYLEAESEFILSPNRLNVALSRMKKKLVVIAPRSLFEVIPSDVDEYDKAIIWKGLHERVDAEEDPLWKGQVKKFTGLGGDETNIEVYNATEDN